MTPLERAAQALKAEILKDEPEFVFGDGGADALSYARAALLAIREPSEAMQAVGFETGWELYPSNDAEAARMSRETWQAMIDAALEEG